MAELRVPGDGVPPIKAVYEQYFGPEVLVVDEVPDEWDVLTDLPLIMVSDDGGPSTWPVWAQVVIRSTIYANGKQTAKSLRRTATGVLLANVPNGMAIRKTGLGYTDGRDPDTGADLASFTVNATVRTEVITV